MLRVHVVALLCCLCNQATGFNVAARVPSCTAAAASVRMQTLVPDAPTIDVPDTLPPLPETWEVPDTFCFTDRMSEEPPFFKVTLFQSKKYDEDYVVGSLVKVTAIEETRAREIAKQVMSMGFAVVGEYVQEVAEEYGEGLKGKGLVCDVSPTSC